MANENRRIPHMRAAIVANGTVDPQIVSPDRLGQYNCVIGCDGGAAYLFEMGVKPHLLIGDFDSVDRNILQFYVDHGVPKMEFRPEKDDTDLQLAVNAAIEKGYTNIDLYGVTGNRLDHTTASMMLLFSMKENGVRGMIVDKNNIIFAAEPLTEISQNWAMSVFSGSMFSGDGRDLSSRFKSRAQTLYISLVMIEDCSGICLEGFKYPLHDFYGRAGTSRCISNELLGEKGTIRFQEGKMLVFISRDCL